MFVDDLFIDPIVVKMLGVAVEKGGVAYSHEPQSIPIDLRTAPIAN